MQSTTQIKSKEKLQLVPTPALSCCIDKLYTLDNNEKYEEFLIELGANKDVRVSAIDSKPTVMLCLQNNAYVLNTVYPEGKTVKVRFRPKEKAFRRRPCGELIQSTFDLLDNILTERFTVDNIDVTIERVFTKTEMLVTMKTDAFRCFRRYSASPSKHSIDTETSRRSGISNPVDMLLSQESETFADDESDNATDTSNELQICL